MPDNDAMHKRHEDHFTKIFSSIDDIRNNYIRSPTFVVSLLTIVLIVAGSAGWFLSIIFTNIDKNEASIMELARQQVRLEEKQNSIKENQQKTITQLINALKPTRVN